MTIDRPPTILIAEDDRLLRRLAVEVMIDEGYEAIGVASAGEALARLHVLPDITLLVTDINMPGMSGLELVALVTVQYPAVKLLVISGREPTIFNASIGPAKFLQKPFSARGFLDCVKHLLEQ